MKRIAPVLLLLCLVLIGCSSSTGTVAIESIKQEAYNNGYEEGKNVGYAQGHAKGYAEGYAAYESEYDEEHILKEDAVYYAVREYQKETIEGLCDNDIDFVLSYVSTEYPDVLLEYASYVMEETPPIDPPVLPTITYIANKNTMKFHKPDCGSVNDIDKANRLDWEGDRQGLIDKGYEPCKRCNP